MKHDDIKEDKVLIKKAFGMHDAQEHKGEHTNLTKLCGGGMAKGGSASSRADGCCTKGKTKGKMV